MLFSLVLKILDRGKLDIFCRQHADARRWIENWLADAEAADWRSPHDVRNRYSSASFIGSGTVIFNVKGNTYRLEVLVLYKTQAVAIEWIGTHAAYDERNRKR